MALTKVTKNKTYLEEHYHILEIDGELYAEGPRGIRKIKTYKINKRYKSGRIKEYLYVYNFDYIDKRPTFMTWHQLLYIWYKGEVPAGYDVDHIDGNPLNNSLDNLQVLTRAENNRKRKGVTAHHPVICLETGIEYESIIGASRKTGVPYSSIYTQLKGKPPKNAKYHFISKMED